MLRVHIIAQIAPPDHLVPANHFPPPYELSSLELMRRKPRIGSEIEGRNIPNFIPLIRGDLDALLHTLRLTTYRINLFLYLRELNDLVFPIGREDSHSIFNCIIYPYVVRNEHLSRFDLIRDQSLESHHLVFALAMAASKLMDRAPR